MPRRARRFVFLGSAVLAIAILVPVGIGLWNRVAVPRFQGRLEQTIGRRVQIAGLGIGGLHALVARGVEVFGAPPFDSEPVVRAERIVVRLGGPGRGFWEPAEVTADGLDVEYLRTGAADNLFGQPSARVPSLASGSRRSLREMPLALAIRRARVHGAVVLPGGLRIDFRTPDASFQRPVDGKPSASLRDLVLDLGGTTTLRVSEVSIESPLGPSIAATGRGASLLIPGGGVLADGATVEARFAGQGMFAELRRTDPGGASPGLLVSARTASDVAELLVDARDWPLRALGVVAEPRGLGLDDARADLHVVASLDMERRRVPFQIDGQVRGLQIHHPAVDRAPWRDLIAEMHVSGQVATAAGRVDIESAELRALGAQLEVKGWAELLGTPRGEFTISTPRAAPLPCSALLAAQAQPIRQALAGLTLGGKLGVAVSFSFDSAAWETLTLDVRVDPRCTVKTEPQVLANLTPALLHEIPTGPLAPNLPLGKYHADFASLAEMPSHLPAAFLTSEDSRFYAHNGFDIEMIRHALVQDLETRTFGRGASTITQQLAKNLFLSPHRTLARKLEETVLAWRLHNLLGKDRILEIYLNVIDLGPGIRGVRQAARVYFGKELRRLLPIESAYLAALTPNPHVLARRFRDGHVDDGWLQRLHDLLAMMRRSGRLTSEELSASRASKPALRKLDKEPRPAL
ncbi:MAG: biosynthetic peptidoglycan transglycosylase [Polyangia bacterium]